VYRPRALEAEDGVPGDFIGGTIAWFAFRDAIKPMGWEKDRAALWWNQFHGRFVALTLAIALVLTIYSFVIYLYRYRGLFSQQGRHAARDSRCSFRAWTSNSSPSAPSFCPASPSTVIPRFWARHWRKVGGRISRRTSVPDEPEAVASAVRMPCSAAARHPTGG
jgi:hypothetical protein